MSCDGPWMEEHRRLREAARTVVEVCVPDWPGQDRTMAVEARAAALDALRAALGGQEDE